MPDELFEAVEVQRKQLAEAMKGWRAEHDRANALAAIVRALVKPAAAGVAMLESPTTPPPDADS